MQVRLVAKATYIRRQAPIFMTPRVFHQVIAVLTLLTACFSLFLSFVYRMNAKDQQEMNVNKTHGI